MKKFIGIALLLLFSVFLSGQTSYLKSDKDTITLKITTETKKQTVANETFQSQLIEAIGNQALATESVATFVDTFSVSVSQLAKAVEERNKDDSQLITDKFNYSPNEVKHVIKIERWLNFLVALLILIYVLWAVGGDVISWDKQTAGLLSRRLLCILVMGATFYFLLLKLLTLLFNGDYYVIKELITLYT